MLVGNGQMLVGGVGGNGQMLVGNGQMPVGGVGNGCKWQHLAASEGNGVYNGHCS